MSKHNDHHHGHEHSHHDHAHDHAHGHACGHDHHHGSDDLVFTRLVANHIKIAAVLLKDAPSLSLTYAQRQHPPHEITLSDGRQAFLHLDESLQAGDRLVAEVNRWAVVQAAAEPLLELTGSSEALLIGCVRLTQANEPVMVTGEQVVARDSDAVRRLVQGLGLHARALQGPFTPLETDRRKVHTCDHPDHHHGHEHGHGHHHHHHHHDQ